MKQTYIGTFELGWRNVDLYGYDGAGARACFLPDKKGNAHVEIGMSQPWRQVFRDIFHESGEFLACDRQHTYSVEGAIAQDAGAKLFVFDHMEWSEISAHQADFIRQCQAALKRARREWQKNAKRSRKNSR